jgi:hypothetical protein
MNLHPVLGTLSQSEQLLEESPATNHARKVLTHRRTALEAVSRAPPRSDLMKRMVRFQRETIKFSGHPSPRIFNSSIDKEWAWKERIGWSKLHRSDNSFG